VVDPARVDVPAGCGVRYSIELWDHDRSVLVREVSG
jgi:hypothetical protein